MGTVELTLRALAVLTSRCSTLREDSLRLSLTSLTMSSTYSRAPTPHRSSACTRLFVDGVWNSACEGWTQDLGLCDARV